MSFLLLVTVCYMLVGISHLPQMFLSPGVCLFDFPPVLGVKHIDSDLLSKNSTTELHPQPL